MSQQGNYYSEPVIKAAIDSAREAARDNPKTLKAIALAENIIGTAGLFSEHVKLRFPNKKRIFSKRDRNPKKLKKQQKAYKLAVNSMQIHMSMMQQLQIMSQPLPKYPKGSANDNDGLAYVGGENGEEMIIQPKRKPAYSFPVTKEQFELMQKHAEMNKQNRGVMIPISISEGKLSDILNAFPRSYGFVKDGVYTEVGVINPCEHVFGTKPINGNWNGDMSAICMKCGYQP